MIRIINSNPDHVTDTEGRWAIRVVHVNCCRARRAALPGSAAIGDTNIESASRRLRRYRYFESICR